MPNARPDNALQDKIYETLVADATLQSLLGGSGRIKDMGNVQDNQAFPYIQIDQSPLEDWGSYTHSGFQGSVDLHIWSRGLGKKPCHDIQDRVYTLLHNINLGLSGYPTIAFRCVLSDVQVEPDNRTFRGLMRFRVMLGGNNP